MKNHKHTRKSFIRSKAGFMAGSLALPNGMWNDCGALYKMAPPKVNMGFPPGVWQSYYEN